MNNLSGTKFYHYSYSLNNLRKTKDRNLYSFENELYKVFSYRISNGPYNIGNTGSSQFDSRTYFEPLDENAINARRMNYLNTNVKSTLIRLFKDEEFDFGYDSKSEMLLKEEFKQNETATKSWLNSLFLEYYDNITVLTGILRILGRFEEKLIFPEGMAMALGGFSHKSDEVKELCIRAFENWGSKNSLKVLRNTKVEINWLQEYINEIVTSLEKEYGPLD